MSSCFVSQQFTNLLYFPDSGKAGERNAGLAVYRGRQLYVKFVFNSNCESHLLLQASLDLGEAGKSHFERMSKLALKLLNTNYR